MVKKGTPRWVQIFSVILLAALVCFALFNAVIDIFAKPNAALFEDTPESGDYVSGTGAYATGAFFGVKHSVGGLIPIRTDYYYLAFNRRESDYIAVRAEKNWNERVAHMGADFEIEGRVRTLPSGGSRAVESALGELNKAELPVTYIYVDTLARSNGIKIVIGFLLAAVGALICFKGTKKQAQDGNRKNAVGLSGLAVFIVGLMLVLYAMC